MSKKNTKFKKLIILILLLTFIFSIFKIESALAQEDTFVITNAEVTAKSENVDISNFSFEKCNITKDVVFHKLGDSVTYKITVKNNDEKNYTIKSVKDDNKNPYISYEYKNYEGIKLNSKEETTFELTEKYTTEIGKLSDRNQNFKVNITFTLEDEEGNTEEKTIPIEKKEETPEVPAQTESKEVKEEKTTIQPVKEEKATTNPKTGDEIVQYSIIALISLILLMRISKKNKVKSKAIKKYMASKHSKKLFSLIIIGMLLVPTIVKAVDSSLVITFDSKMTLKDKLLVSYTINGNDYEKIVKYNEKVEGLEQPTKEGYNFTKWEKEDGTEFNSNETIKDDVKFEAKFTPITYTISYDLNGGNLEQGKTNPTEYTVETEDIELNNPKKTGYKFAGWTGTNLTDKTEKVTIAKGSTENKTYTANWTKEEYTITYHLNSGTATGNPDAYTIESDNITLNKPTRFAYDFQGWTGTGLTDKTKEVTIAKGSTGNREYTANWTPTKYTIKYKGLTEAEESALNNPKEYNIETPSFTLKNPQNRKDNDGDETEKFVGWKENTTTSINVTIPTELGNKEYEAMWVAVDPNKYSVTYDLKGGTVSEENPVEFTKFQTFTLHNPTKRGYTFAGWTGTNITDKTIEVTVPLGTRENLEYTANWTVDNYTIKTKYEDGTAIATIPYTVESENITLQAPTKTGYIFKGWTGTDLTEKTMEVTIPQGSIGNKEYTANFEANKYSIVFDRNTGSGSMANKQMTYDTEDNLPPNTFTKTGYKFDGWKDANGTSYTNGQAVKNLATEEGATVTLYAQWKPIKYTVVFNKNHDTATGTMESQTFDYDEEKTLTPNAFARQYYNFKKWTTDPEGNGVIYTDGKSVKNLTAEDGATFNLYAQWEGNAYKVIFDKNNNNATGTMEPQDFNYGTAQNLTSNNYSLEHYKFMGWMTSPTATTVTYTDGQEVNNLATGGELRLYANWKERTATLQTGSDVNSILRTLNANATKFTHYTGTPDFDTIEGEQNIATTDSNFPVWTWTEGNTIYWWSEAEVPNMNANSASMFANMTKITETDLTGLNKSPITNLSLFYSGCTSLVTADLSQLSDAKPSSIAGMFSGATHLTTVDVSKLNTANTQDMSDLFKNCTSITSLDMSKVDTGNVKNMQGMFSNMSNLTSIKLYDTESTTKFNTSKVYNMIGMFCGLSKIETLDVSHFVFNNVEMYSFASDDTKLKHIYFPHENVKIKGLLTNVFNSDSALEELDLSGWDITNVTSVGRIFTLIEPSYIDLTGWDTSNLTSFDSMFSEVGSKTKTIYASYTFEANLGTQSGNPFQYMTSLNNIVGGAGTECNGTRTYLRIDDPDNGKPGCLTLKGARYIRYNGNGADAGTGTDMTSHYLTNTGNLKTNTFTKDGYVFMGWNTEPDGSGTYYKNGKLMSDLTESKTPLTLYAQWIDEMNTVFSLEGPVRIYRDASNVSGTLSGIKRNVTEKNSTTVDFTNQTYINSGVQLFNEANYNRDFEIGVEIDSVNYFNNSVSASNSYGQPTIVNSKWENGSKNYPGFVFRRYNGGSSYELSSRAKNNNTDNKFTGTDKSWPYESVHTLKLYRENNKLYYSINDNAKVEVHSFDPINYYFDTPVTFGASTDGSGNPFRYIDGTLKNMYIKLQVKPEDYN